MNILLIYESKISVIGGTGTYLREVAEGLARSGHKVYVAYPNYDENKETKDEGVTYVPIKVIDEGNHRNNTYRFISGVNEMFDYFIPDNKIDIVHVIFGWYAFASIDYSRVIKNGAKAFVTVHNVPPQECMESFKGDAIFNRLKDIVQNALRAARSFVNIQSIDKRAEIVVPCENVKKRLKRYGCKNNIHVIAHGYSESLVNGYKYSSYERKIKSVLTVAGIAPGKNQKLLIDAIYILPNRNKIKVFFVGPIRNLRYYEYLKKYIHDKGLDNIFDFVIGCSDEKLVELYRECSLYVQPSKHEGFCMAALDAAAFGLRVVGSDVGELKNISELSGGRYAQYNNAYEYSKAIEGLIESDKVNEGTVDIIKDRYNWGKSVKALIELYN